MAKEQKKFNFLVFILLLLFLFPAGIIYAIVKAVQAYKSKHGNVSTNGYSAKLTGALIGVIFSILMAIIFRDEDGLILFIIIGIVALVLAGLAIAGNKTNKKIFNLLYLIVLVIYFILPLPIMMIQMTIALILCAPTTIGSIFGVVGVIKAFKAQ